MSSSYSSSCSSSCSSGFVEPICLPNHGEEFEEGTMCWISGWGATEEDGESEAVGNDHLLLRHMDSPAHSDTPTHSRFAGETSVNLRSATVPLLSSRTCNQPEVYHGFISSWMICAGYLEGGTDSCQVHSATCPPTKA